ncbi:MoaD/ThiS family protein [Desulfovibrio cuneatus]|uniref:MoaD/ThiS family protein n=1 Tax=Desulfovibrio cuneatus TaxID=159728 RepID=UPI0003F84851|nr:MoaD/ThiS family protein [Desulfovibrio cuneatus]
MKMESISVQGIGPLAHKIPESVMQVEAGLTVGGLLEQLGISQKEVMLVFVDSALATWQTMLRDGSRVCLSPYMCGG